MRHKKSRPKSVRRAERSRQHARDRLRQYAMSPESYRALREAHGGVCAICGGMNRDRDLSIDHCHDSGRVRGLLCNRCNTAIGLLREDPDLVAATLTYLMGPTANTEILVDAIQRQWVTFHSWCGGEPRNGMEREVGLEPTPNDLEGRCRL